LVKVRGLAPDSLPDIIENYVHFFREVDKSWDPYKGKVVGKPKELLTSLYRNKDETHCIFDTIIVVTDRGKNIHPDQFRPEQIDPHLVDFHQKFENPLMRQLIDETVLE